MRRTSASTTRGRSRAGARTWMPTGTRPSPRSGRAPPGCGGCIWRARDSASNATSWNSTRSSGSGWKPTDRPACRCAPTGNPPPPRSRRADSARPGRQDPGRLDRAARTEPPGPGPPGPGPPGPEPPCARMPRLCAPAGGGPHALRGQVAAGSGGRGCGQNDEVESSRSRPRDVVLLGSTGSVGTQAADVIRRNPGRFRVTGLAAGGGNPDLLAAQAIEFGVAVVAVAQESAADGVREALKAQADRAGRPRTGPPPAALTGQRLARPGPAGAHGLPATS